MASKVTTSSSPPDGDASRVERIAPAEVPPRGIQKAPGPTDDAVQLAKPALPPTQLRDDVAREHVAQYIERDARGASTRRPRALRSAATL